MAHDRQQPARRGRTAELWPVQLEADHPRLTGVVHRVPTERQVAGKVAALGADVRPLRLVQIYARDGRKYLLDRRGLADSCRLQRGVHSADIGGAAVPLDSV